MNVDSRSMNICPAMRRFSSLLCLLTAFISVSATGEESGSTPIAKLNREQPVDFQREILPILRRNCLACHNNTDAESDLILEQPASILAGGDSGPAVVPGNGAESLLLSVAAYQTEPEMPPPDNDVGARRLTSEELGLIQLWIEQGAEEGSGRATEVDWQPLPQGVNPVYAVAVSPDGQYAAAGRANQIFMYHLPSARMVGRLSDPALVATGIYERPGVAHLDLVQSLQFSPDGKTLASGGYQTVKLWRRAPARRLSLASLAGEATAVAIAPNGRTVAVGMLNGNIRLISGALTTTLKGHTLAISNLQFGGNQQLISSSLDATVRYWDLEQESLIGTLETAAPVSAMIGLAEGRIATGGDDGIIHIWEALDAENPAAEPLVELTGHGERVTSLAFHQPANHLVSGSHDGTIRVWDLQANQQLRSSDHDGPVEAVAVRADGQRFASAGSNKVTRLWDADGKQVAELKGDYRQQLLVEQAERIVAVANRGIENAKADLKELTDRKVAEEKNAKQSAEAIVKAEEELQKKDEVVKQKATQEEETLKLVASAKEAINRVTAEKSEVEQMLAEATAVVAAASEALAAAQQAAAEATAKMKAAQETQAQVAQQVTAAKDQLKEAETSHSKALEESKKAATARDASRTAVENARRASTRAEQALKSATALVAPAEKAVKTAEETHSKKGKLLEQQKHSVVDSEQPQRAVAFSADGLTVATGGDGGTLSTWDAETGVPVESHDGHQSAICAITHTSQGHLVTLARDGDLVIWDDDAQWQHLRSIGSPGDAVFVDRVTALDFSPAGDLLATGGGEPSRSGELKIWRVADGSLVREIEDAHSDTIQCLRFSPDGSQLASSGADRFAKVIDVESGKAIRAFEGHTHHVLGISWRADGRLLATSGADNVVKIWDARTGDQKRTITGFNKEVTAVCFLAATDNVVASSGDKSVQLKNTSNGRQIRNLSGAGDFMYSVSASANGKTIVGGGQDSVVRVWQEDGKLIFSFSPPAE